MISDLLQPIIDFTGLELVPLLLFALLIIGVIRLIRG